LTIVNYFKITVISPAFREGTGRYISGSFKWAAKYFSKINFKNDVLNEKKIK
jgi:hypothetical protein